MKSKRLSRISFTALRKFAQEIEQMVQTHEDMNYIDAIVSFCEINSIDMSISS